MEELSTFENEINDSIENVKTKVDLPTAVFRYYRNGFEKTLCNKLYPEKSVINLDINLPEVLESKAQLLFVLKRYDEAYETAKKEYERMQALVGDKIVSAKDFEQARLNYENA